jgi:hypothetical protein
MSLRIPRLQLIIISAVCLLVIGVTLFAQTAKPPVHKGWEYKDGANLTLAQLNDYGADGWELASVIPYGEANNLYIFKRPR